MRPPWAAESVSTGSLGQESVITAAEDTECSWKSELQSNSKENTLLRAEKEVFTATEMESVLCSVSDVMLNTQVGRLILETSALNFGEC